MQSHIFPRFTYWFWRCVYWLFSTFSRISTSLIIGKQNPLQIANLHATESRQSGVTVAQVSTIKVWAHTFRFVLFFFIVIAESDFSAGGAGDVIVAIDRRRRELFAAELDECECEYLCHNLDPQTNWLALAGRCGAHSDLKHKHKQYENTARKTQYNENPSGCQGASPRLLQAFLEQASENPIDSMRRGQAAGQRKYFN